MQIHKNLIFTFFSIMLCICCSLKAQEIPFEEIEESPMQIELLEDDDPFSGYIHLTGKNYGDSLRLRWAPSKAAAWYYAKDSGYYIVRIPFKDGIIDTANAKQMNETPIKPWSIEKFEQMYHAGELDTMSLMVAQMVHGDNQLESLSPIERSDMLKMRFSYSALCADLSAQAAEAAGLAFTDFAPGQDSAYVYEIYSPTDTSLFVLENGAYYYSRYQIDTVQIPSISQVNSLDKAVSISWQRNFHELFFSAYYIERSPANVDDWQRRNIFPYLPVEEESGPLNQFSEFIQFKDTFPDNEVLYKYRLIGITPFGELSLPSTAVAGIGIDAHKPPPPTHVDVKEETAGKLTVSWQLPHEVYDDETDSGDILGFLVARSTESTGPFVFLTEEMLPATTRIYTDTLPVNYVHNYYLVYSLNEAGKYTISLPANGSILDTIPPAVPEGFAGNIDSSGLVTLSWHLGTEPDLKGYFVYFDHQEYGVFNRITDFPLQDINYEHKVTLHTLSREIYYKLAAVDLVGNVSEKTPWLKLMKPDIYPPVPPQITDIKILENDIQLEWASSSSFDVVAHFLERKSPEENEWKEILSLSSWEIYNIYHDKDLLPDTWYEYRLYALDSSGLRSEFSDTLSLRTPWIQKDIAIPTLIATYDIKTKSVLLNWEIDEDDIRYFTIFRVNQNGDLNKINKISSQQRNYNDQLYNTSTWYDYSIRANIKGRFGGFSNEVRVVIPEN